MEKVNKKKTIQRSKIFCKNICQMQSLILYLKMFWFLVVLPPLRGVLVVCSCSLEVIILSSTVNMT